jgi:hypothetical protein
MDLQLPTTIFLVIDLAAEGLPFQPDRVQGMPVRWFTSREVAETCCADFEREKRGEVNPFEFGETLEALTYLDADRLHDWILDVGLEPPFAGDEARHDDWVRWWDELSPAMTELQRAKVWQALAKLRFYRVDELQAAEGW